MNNYKKIIFVGYHDKSHSSNAGYDHIAKMPSTDYYNAEYVQNKRPTGIIGSLIWHLRIELMYAKTRLLLKQYDIVHCFYGDTLLLPIKGHNSHKVVLTVHLDVRQQRKFPKMFWKVLRAADGIIVLSNEQANILKEVYGINATFIPHGFNKPKYKFQLPSKKTSLPNIYNDLINIFVAGQQYRDIETTVQIINFCEANKKNVRFHILGAKGEIVNQLKGRSNVITYPRLSDNEYYSLLSICDYNFLPVTFATANNTLLEGQSLGITGILPRISGIIDYAAPEPLNKLYNNLEDLKDYFLHIEKKAPSSEIRKFAESFEWRNVYKLLNTYYKSL